VKALIAALDFIITNGAKYNVDDQVLVTELQQLGLPKGEPHLPLSTQLRVRVCACCGARASAACVVC
jgi:hypothetical protein